MLEFAVAPLALFAFAATGTPGPNNIINLSQGLRLGFLRALPFAIGAGLGVASLVCAAAFGLGALFEAAPRLEPVMAAAAALTLLYLAWRIATAGPLNPEGDARRLGFTSGVALQWINPKTWTTALTAATAFLPP